MAFAIGITLLILFVIAFGLWYFERILARKKERVYGLIMPVAFLILSVVAVVQSAPTVFSQMQTSGNGIAAAIFSLALSFVLVNLPTLLVYVVYFRTRKKMGERPWPLRAQPNDTSSDHSNQP